MATVYVNGKAVDIGNERLNLIQAAEKADVLIPHYCWHPALSVVASCRMCLVEVGEMKDGKPLMQPRVVPGCQTPAKDGTVIITDSAKAKAAQAGTLEGLLLNHPLDCPVCDKAGECKLQDYSFEFGNAESRMIDEKNTPPNKPDLGKGIALFTDRCIMCSRCVRFTREIAGTAELQVIGRGSGEEIGTFPGRPIDNKLSGNVVDLCPVGALGSKDFLYKQRVWFLKHADSVCPGCSTGCSIEVDTNKDVVFRLRPRPNPQAQGYFMCDEGRYGYHYINSSERITRPHMKRDGGLKPSPWADVIPNIRRDFQQIATQHGGGSIVGVLSPFLTVEEAYLLGKYLRSISPDVKLALGMVPFVGEDDQYPKNVRGEVVPPVKFTIRAEKCPNRRGVEQVIKHLQGNILTFTDIVQKAKRGEVKALYLTGGYPAAGWLDANATEAFSKIESLVVQDFFKSDLLKSASYALPATSHAEKEGVYVNYALLAQVLHRAIRSPQEGRVEGQVFMDLMGRRGLIHVPTVRAELAKEIPFFRPLAGEIGKNGVMLGEAAMTAAVS